MFVRFAFCARLLVCLDPLADQAALKVAPADAKTIVYQLEHPGQVSLAVYDSAGRQVRTLLAGQKQAAGRHTAVWDGLDRSGQPVPPGTYQWQLLGTPGFTRHFMVSVGTNPTWSAFDLWPGNHAGPTSVMIDRDGALYVGSVSSEGPPHILKLSLDGRRKYWDTGTWGFDDGLCQIARIDDAVFILKQDGGLWIRSADTGREFWDHPQRRKFATKHIPFADLIHLGDASTTSPVKTTEVSSPMCMAAGPDYLVVTYEKRDEVRIFWLGVDRIIRSQCVHVAKPKGVAIAPGGRVFVVSGQAVVRVDVKNGQVKELIHDAGQRYPTRLAYDKANDDLLVAQRGPGVNHVRRYSARDGSLVAVYGRPAGRVYGPFNPLDWDTILDIASDGQGGFVTVEEFPRRVSHFRGRDKHELVRQWVGGMQWGGLCALDPADCTTVYLFPDHKHCARGRIDYPTRSWTLTHLYELPEDFSWNVGKESHREMFPPLGGGSYWSVRHVGASTFLVNRGGLEGSEGVSVVRIDEKEQKLVPVARLGVLHPDVDKKKPPAWWLAAMRRAGFAPDRPGNDHFSYAWSDNNHNGKVDVDEIVLARRFQDYTESHFWLDEAWNVFRISRVDSANHTSRSDARGNRAQWAPSVLVPNRGKNLLDPVWNWDDMLQSPARLTQREFGGITPRPVGLYYDSAGSLYEVCNGENDASALDIPPSSWPNNTTAASRFVKWSAQGRREWTIGSHTDSKHPSPGKFSDIRGILGEARECLVVLDACSPATVWTREGLYAGSFIDARAQDGLPDLAYQRIMADDNLWGVVVETPAKEVIWGAMSDQSTLFYRIEGWENWQRHSGKLTLKQRPSAARAKGTGLTAEYFDNLTLAGRPVLTRQDPDIWFGPMWGDHRELKARNGWLKDQEPRTFDPGSCSARWTGSLEPPLTEQYEFVIYAYGQRPDENSLFGSKVRLWIDGKKVIDEWDNVKLQKVDGWLRTRNCHSTKVSLQAGKPVRIELEYVGTGGNEANLHLYWQSASLDLRHVPHEFLYPTKPGK
jgi:hypothetical protein